MSTTKLAALDLSSDEREALVAVGHRLTWGVAGGDADDAYRDDPARMLDDADALVNGARITMAARGTLPDTLWQHVRRALPDCLEGAREVVNDAHMYSAQEQRTDAAVLRGLLSLESRLVEASA